MLSCAVTTRQRHERRQSRTSSLLYIHISPARLLSLGDHHPNNIYTTLRHRSVWAFGESTRSPHQQSRRDTHRTAPHRTATHSTAQHRTGSHRTAAHRTTQHPHFRLSWTQASGRSTICSCLPRHPPPPRICAMPSALYAKASSVGRHKRSVC